MTSARPARRALAPLLVIGALIAIWLVLGQKVPRDQTVHVVLGDLAPRVTEVRIRYAPLPADGKSRGRNDGEADEAELAREATFRFAPDDAGSGASGAPRIVTHEPRLADGDWTIEIDVVEGKDRVTVSRKVKLGGSPVSIDVREALK